MKVLPTFCDEGDAELVVVRCKWKTDGLWQAVDGRLFG